MLGYLFSIIAGAAMSFQGVMNTRLGEKVGIFASNAYVQGTAFALSLLALLFAKDTNFNGFAQTNKIYFFGGVLGLVITVTVMLSIKNLSPVLLNRAFSYYLDFAISLDTISAALGSSFHSACSITRRGSTSGVSPLRIFTAF